MAWWNGGTTDISGVAFGNPTAADEQAASRIQAAQVDAASRENAARLTAAAHENAADITAGNIRGTGTLTKYRPIGGWQDRGPGAGTGKGSLRDLAESAEFGAPTSYNGGGGVPEAIGVIRGMRQTYAPPTQPGQQFIEGEYSNPLRAAQAYNQGSLRDATTQAMTLSDQVPAGSPPGALSPRAQALADATERYGGYDSPEAPKLRLLASLENKRPDLKAQADLIHEKGLRDLFQERLLKEFGQEDKEKGLILPSSIQRLALGHRPQSQAEVDSIIEKIRPEAEKVNRLTAYNDPQKGMALRRQILAGLPAGADETLKKYVKESPVTPENMGWFETQFNKAPKVAPGPPAPATSSPIANEGFGANLLDRASLLGNTLSYELQPSLRKAGIPAPTLDSVRAARIAERERLWKEQSQPLRVAAPAM